MSELNQPLKGIIDKILWAGLDIQEVVDAYKAESKARADHQKEIDEIRSQQANKPEKKEEKKTK